MMMMMTLIIIYRQNGMVQTTFSLIILILESLCDVLYECMLNSTEKLQINQFLSYLISYISWMEKRTDNSIYSTRI